MTSRLDDLDWPLRTARLSIRRATDADLEPTWEFRRLDGVSEWMTGGPKTLEDYRQRFETPDRLVKTLVFELGGVVVGDLMLNVGDAWGQAEVAEQAAGVQAELGWCLDPRHGGHGLATEAVEALIRLCFADLGLRRVTAACFADNEASWRLMERVGMRREVHTVRESLHRSRGWLDGMAYGMLADEWRARRSAG